MPNEANDGQNVTLNCQVFHGVLDRPKKNQAIVNGVAIVNSAKQATS